MDLWSPLPQLEAVFYRRNLTIGTSFEYHNHVLQGSHLRYIQRRLKPKDVGRFRLVLVQGTSRGRMMGLKLHTKSEIVPIVVTNEADLAIYPTKHLINVTGFDPQQNEISWQLAFGTEREQLAWVEALKKASMSTDISIASGEADKLRDLAHRMKEGMDIRKRFSRFKFYDRSFVGVKAVKWLMQEKSCTVSQAIAIGNKLLNFGLLSHVNHEHLFCAKNLLYRFSVEIDPLVTARNDDDGDADDDNHNIEHLIMAEISNDTNQLLSSYHRVQQELKALQAAHKLTAKRCELILNKYNNVIGKHLKLLRNVKVLDWLLFITCVGGCLAVGYTQWYTNVEEQTAQLTTQTLNTIVVALIVMNTVMKRGLYGLIHAPNTDDSTKPTALSAITATAATSTATSSTSDITVTMSEDSAADDFLLLSDDDGIDEEDDDDSDDDDDDEDGSECEPVESEMDDNKPLPRSGTKVAMKLKFGHHRTFSNGSNDDDSTVEEGDDADSSHTDDASQNTSTLITPGTARSMANSASNRKELQRHKSWQAVAQLPQPTEWPNFPILIRRAVSMLTKHQQLSESLRHSLMQPLHIHKTSAHPTASIVPVESDLFVGHVYMVCANLPDSPTDYFKNKKRKFQYILQGRFKRAIPFSSVYTGQAYSEPISQLPAKWLLRAIIKILAKFQPALQLSLTGDKPYIIAPLVSAAQNMVISKPGTEPRIHTLDIEEDVSLLGGYFLALPRMKRKAFFARRSNLQNYTFDPNLVYTFDMYEHMVNFSTFQIDFGFLKYDLIKPLGVRPVQLMSVLWDPIADGGNPPQRGWNYLYNFEVFHKRSVPSQLLQQQPEQEQEQHNLSHGEKDATRTTSSSASVSTSTAMATSPLPPSNGSSRSSNSISNSSQGVTPPRQTMLSKLGVKRRGSNTEHTGSPVPPATTAGGASGGGGGGGGGMWKLGGSRSRTASTDDDA